MLGLILILSSYISKVQYLYFQVFATINDQLLMHQKWKKNYPFSEFLITVVRHKKRRSNRCTTYFSVFWKLKRLKSVWSFWNMNFEHLLCYKFVCVYYIWSLHYYFTLSDLFIHIEHICWLNQLVLSYF